MRFAMISARLCKESKKERGIFFPFARFPWRYSWISLFLALVFLFYRHAQLSHWEERKYYERKRDLLLAEREKGRADRAILQLQLRYCEEPHWRTWYLIDRLGLVPEGQQKVLIVPRQKVAQRKSS